MSNRIFFFPLLLVMLTSIGCNETIRRESASPASIAISWEFRNIMKEGTAYTDAVMVVKGTLPQRHALGLFYGALQRVLKAELKIKELQGGTLSGFITDTDGKGTEVLVRFDEYKSKLVVVVRQFAAGSPPAAFKTYLVVPIRTQELPASGF